MKYEWVGVSARITFLEAEIPACKMQEDKIRHESLVYMHFYNIGVGRKLSLENHKESKRRHSISSSLLQRRIIS